MTTEYLLRNLLNPNTLKNFARLRFLYTYTFYLSLAFQINQTQILKISFTNSFKKLFSEIYPCQRKPNQCGFRSPGALRVYVEPLCLNIDTGDVRTRPCVVRCVYNYTLQQCSEPVLKLNLLHELTQRTLTFKMKLTRPQIFFFVNELCTY